MKGFLLFSMIFFHIVDDYYLQGWLASAKQRKWWKENCPDKKYQDDYIVALIMHSFSWSFMIMIPAVIYRCLLGVRIDLFFNIQYVFCLLSNLLIHCLIDDLKANEGKINLIQDQTIHMCQIILTWWFVSAV